MDGQTDKLMNKKSWMDTYNRCSEWMDRKTQCIDLHKDGWTHRWRDDWMDVKNNWYSGLNDRVNLGTHCFPPTIRLQPMVSPEYQFISRVEKSTSKKKKNRIHEKTGSKQKNPGHGWRHRSLGGRGIYAHGGREITRCCWGTLWKETVITAVGNAGEQEVGDLEYQSPEEGDTTKQEQEKDKNKEKEGRPGRGWTCRMLHWKVSTFIL